MGRSGQEWAVIFGVIANREDVIERLAEKFVNVLGTVAGDVDAELAHDGDCLWANVAWFGSGARDLEAMARVVAEEAFGHLASGGISGAENEDSFFIRHGGLRSQVAEQASEIERLRRWLRRVGPG